MSSHLSEGQGLCIASHVLQINPVRAAIELGAGPDIVAETFRAVHDTNRKGKKDDRIALAFPNMNIDQGSYTSGFLMELISSAQSLETLLQHACLEKLRRRGMIQELKIDDAWLEPGEIGGAYVRVRSGEKYSKGGQRRMKARAERRGIKLAGKPKAAKLKSYLSLHCGKFPIQIDQKILKMSDSPLEVSTYGLSSPSNPAALPVQPMMSEHAETAA